MFTCMCGEMYAVQNVGEAKKFKNQILEEKTRKVLKGNFVFWFELFLIFRACSFLMLYAQKTQMGEKKKNESLKFSKEIFFNKLKTRVE